METPKITSGNVTTEKVDWRDSFEVFIFCDSAHLPHL
jgi:hypothetical protein